MKDYLLQLANKYETKDFLKNDPSQFMHRFSNSAIQERVAFIAAALSYGSRAQFLGKIESLAPVFESRGAITSILPDNNVCFYRLHTNNAIVKFVRVLDEVENNWGSLGAWIRQNNVTTGIDAVKLITSYFAEKEATELIPKNTVSACKRICMFLRWMVRDNSPVDLGLWANQIDKSSLIIPMDTHVLQEAHKLELISSKTTSMVTAIKLTQRLKDFFPDDPTRADFALFGLGVDKTDNE